MGIRAVFSYDNGKTWDTDNIRILRDDGVGNGGDLGYPISVQREDGKIFTIYYMTTQEESFILPKPNRKNNPTLKQQILLEFL